MRQIDWNDKCCNLNNNLNKTTQDIINIINEVTNKHAPIKEASQSKLRQFNKPWITSGILKSIKTKQIVF